MPKGKKFDAAEKHFEKKCIEWRKQVREIERSNKEYKEKYLLMFEELEKIKMENEKLKQENEEIMKLKDMTKEDVRTLIKAKESVNRLDSMMTAMYKVF